MRSQYRTPDTAIVVDRILSDGSLVPVLGRAAALVRAGKLLALGPVKSLSAESANVEVHDYGHDSTLMPGLIDSHVHLTLPGDGTSIETATQLPLGAQLELAERNAGAHLAAGVTTLRDLGSPPGLVAWAGQVSRDLPRILAYGRPITVPAGHMHMFGGAVRNAREAVSIARANIKAGVCGIKLVASGGGTLGTVPHHATLGLSEMAAAVRLTHSHGRLVTSHALANEAVRRSVEAGVDGIEHVAFLDRDGHAALTPEIADILTERRVAIGLTLGVNYRYLELANTGLAPTHELHDQERRSDTFLDHAQILHRRGARVLASSDAGWKYTRFGDFVLELQRMVHAGIPEAEVIRAATSIPAEHLKLRNLGRVAPGYRADLIVLGGNPLADISSLNSVRAVYRSGHRVVHVQT